MQNIIIQSWNAQRELNYTGYTSLKKFKKYLKTFSADIIALQEVCDANKIFKDVTEFDSYNVYIPKINKSPYNRIPDYNYNVILSKYPIKDVKEINFPNSISGKILESVTRVDIQLENKILRIYSCHFGIWGIGTETRLRQLEIILSDTSLHSGPVIICGDLNPTIPKPGWNRWIISHWHHEPRNEINTNLDERELFNQTIQKYGFKESLDLCTPTWSPFKSKIWEMFKLKLDWFIVKNIKVTDIQLGEYISDHKSITARCQVS